MEHIIINLVSKSQGLWLKYSQPEYLIHVSDSDQYTYFEFFENSGMHCKTGKLGEISVPSGRVDYTPIY